MVKIIGKTGFVGFLVEHVPSRPDKPTKDEYPEGYGVAFLLSGWPEQSVNSHYKYFIAKPDKADIVEREEYPPNVMEELGWYFREKDIYILNIQPSGEKIWQ